MKVNLFGRRETCWGCKTVHPVARATEISSGLPGRFSSLQQLGLIGDEEVPGQIGFQGRLVIG